MSENTEQVPPVVQEPGRGGIIVTLGIIGIVLLGPFVGIPAWIMGRKDLKRMKKGEVHPADRTMTEVGMVLGIVGTFFSPMFFIIGGMAIAVALALFSASHLQASKDAMIRDVNAIAAAVHEYRDRPAGAAGGGGSYEGFALSEQMKSTAHGAYQIVILDPDRLQIVGSSVEDTDNGIIATMDETGMIQEWEYSGSFDPNPPNIHVRPPPSSDDADVENSRST